MVRFEDLRSTDVRLSSSGESLLINTADSAKRVKIVNYFASQTYRVEQLQFADGVTWRYADVIGRVR